MNKLIHLSALLGALTFSAAALAQGNSEPGIDRYLENKGRQ
ncbi:MAG: hypothetical protein ACYC0C_00280 [Devosia sp.]